MKIMSLRQAGEEGGDKVLVYGGPGAGKTSLISTLPGKVLVASAEKGLASLDPDADIDVAPIDNVNDLVEVVDVLESKDHGYNWLALDSFSDIAEVVFADELARQSDPRKLYPAVEQRVLRLVRTLRGLNLNVYVTAKAFRVTDSETSRTQHIVKMPGNSLGQQIPYFFDFFFRLRVKKDGERVLQTGPEPDSDAKYRSSRKLEQYEPANLGQLLAKLKGGK